MKCHVTGASYNYYSIERQLTCFCAGEQEVYSQMTENLAGSGRIWQQQPKLCAWSYVKRACVSCSQQLAPSSVVGDDTGCCIECCGSSSSSIKGSTGLRPLSDRTALYHRRKPAGKFAGRIKTIWLTLSVPHFSDCSKMTLPNRWGPYRSNPPFFKFLTFGLSGAQSWAPESPNVKN